MNVVFLCCVVSLSAFGLLGNGGASAAVDYPPQAIQTNCPPLAGAQGVESLSVPSADQSGIDSYAKLMIHADGSDQGTSFTDSETTPKTVTNTESYDSATKLMLHMDSSGNSFTDSAASKTVTTNGDVTQTTAQFKLGSKSAVFDGNGDYLSLADSDDWSFGSGDFTIDFWVRFNNLSNAAYNFLNHVTNINQGNNVAFNSNYLPGQQALSFNYSTDGSTLWKKAMYFPWNPSINTWYHVAFTRNSTNFRAFINGLQVGVTENVGTDAIYNSNNPLTFGQTENAVTGRYFDGYLDELRISKGIARWTSDFTPPSSPYGKVATVTSQKKFGTASGEFKGSGEYLSLADSDDWNFGSGAFTIDFWVKFNKGNSASSFMIGQVIGDSRWHLYVHPASGGIALYSMLNGSTNQDVNWAVYGTTRNLNQWYHFAFVRIDNGNSIASWIAFQDGISQTLTLNTGAWNGPMMDSDQNLLIGSFGGISDFFDGYIDELRISKGIARWTSNFTPPTAPYEVDTTPPSVSSTSPASNSTGVGASSAISATFSEDMDSSTITTSTFTLSSGGVSGSSVGWVKRSAPNKTGDDKDGCWNENPPPDPLQRGTIDGFASLNPSYTTTASTFTPSSSVSGTVSYSNKVATFTPSSNLSYSTTYTATITTGVKDVSGNAMSSTYTWSFTTSSAPDTTAPTNASISINSGASYTNFTAITLTLSATDNVGVVGYYLSTSSSTPTASASGWNSVTSATSYSWSVSYSLTSGDEQKTVYVWYKDAAGNVSNSASDSITLDTTAPIVTITSPTSSDTYTATSGTVSPSGSASDTTSGVKEVTWSSDKGSSGTASGTTYWSVSSISLSSGDNKITVTARDNAGNTSTDTITVTYSAATKPTVTTGSATNVTATSATLTGTVNANGLSTTAWFEYGTLQGTYGNKSSTQTVTGSNDTTVSITISGLTSGTTYYYRIVAENNAGKSEGSEMSFQYNPGGSAPTVTTDAATDVTTTTATLNGKVNANGISTTAWFEYGAQSGSYGNKSNTKAVTGSTDTTVSASISGLTAGTTYYYRIVAQNSAGTSYGKEMSFYYSPDQKAPTVATEAATNVTDTSATLNGKCNPNGLSTTAWFEYGTLSGTYEYKTSTQSMSGSSYTKVSAAITGLTAGTTYYYRIVAKNSVGTSYGTEMEFYKSPGTDTTPTPTATITVTPTLPPSPQQSPTPTPVGSSGSISGDVKDGDGNALQGVTVTIKGNSFTDETETDANGRYEFTELAKGNYTLTYEKDGYQTLTKNVSLGEGEAKDLGSVTLEAEGALGGIYGNVVDIKGDPIESVQIKLKGVKTKVTRTESSDADGYYEFTGLDADTYILTAKKKRYRKFKQTVTLGEGEEKEVEVEMRKTTKKIKGLFLMDNSQ